jgi:hypothetical protein
VNLVLVPEGPSLACPSVREAPSTGQLDLLRRWLDEQERKGRGMVEKGSATDGVPGVANGDK